MYRWVGGGEREEGRVRERCDTATCSVTMSVSLNFRLKGLFRTCIERFRGGLVFKANSLLYHSTLGMTVIKKKKKNPHREDLFYKRDNFCLHT